ncbi:MAG: winged helix-turn-helix transcriptional regulator [Elusimicrobia bacterium]|nr:winged helix-turn-helix transcriptional regulator [Elusimicrobiota bacterium]MBI3013198.1 winged helix-turn-helix transcriptional regulator [Elusimicrobiota bacterium]
MENSYPFSLESQIAVGFERILALYRSLLQRKATELNLTALQIQILSTLHTYPQGISINSLSHHLKLTQATLSDAVSVIVRKKLVQKRHSSQDRRSVVLQLTPKGVQRSGAASHWIQIVSESMGSVSLEQKSNLLKTLIQMIDQLKSAGMIEVARMCIRCSHFRANIHPGTSAPHHCSFIDKPLGENNLKTDCPLFAEKRLETA